MVTRAAKVPVVGGALLITVGRALGTVHVEDDDLRFLAIMNPVDPESREVGQGRQVLLRCQPLRLEAPHLTGRGGTTIKALAVHDGSHRRVERQSLGIVDILIPGQTAIDRLPQQARQKVARVLAAPQVRQRRPTEVGQAENLVQLAVGQEPSVRGDLAAMEFQLRAAVKIDPHMRLSGWTRRVTRVSPVVMMVLH